MPAGTTHHVGGTKHFECRVRGHPRPKIRWFKDNEEITHNPRYKFDMTNDGVISMIIEDISHDDEGHYRCRAENTEGLASTSAYLFVRDHKDHPDASHASIHSMDVEEVVLKGRYTSKKDRGEEPHFQSPIEDADGFGKKRRLSDEEEDLLRKSFDKVIKNAESTRQIMDEYNGEYSSVRSSSKTVISKRSTMEGSFESVSESHSVTSDGKTKSSSSYSSSALEGKKREKPKITAKMDDVKVDAGGVIRIVVSVQGSPMPEIEWSRSGKGLKSGGNVFMSYDGDTCKLEVKDAKESDSGKYKLIAYNMEGESYKDIMVTVSQSTMKPSFESAPKAVNITINEPLKLQVTVKGNPKPTLKWSKDGKPIEDGGKYSVKVEGDKYTLVVKDATEADSGNYKLTASSSAGESSMDIPVKVTPPKVKPSFDTVPKDVNVNELEPVKLMVTIKGYPKPTVTWSKGGKEVKSGGRFSLQCEGDVYTLTIKDAVHADSGTYNLLASNSEGAAKGKAEVMVTPPKSKPVIEVAKPEDSNVSVEENQPVKFGCKIKGFPVPTIKWTKDGKEIVDGGRFSIKFDGETASMEIKDAEVSDSGIYILTATSSEGEMHIEFKVKINPKPAKPKIVKKAEDMEVKEGGTITITSTMEGDPKPSVTWSKDGKELKDGDRISVKCEGDVYTLVIKDATEADAGSYKLTAKSSVGEMTNDVKVKVQSKPEFVKKPEDVTAVEGGTFTISSTIEGDPKPTVSWFKAGKEIKDGGHYSVQCVDCTYTLTIKDAAEADAGGYKCYAKSKAGDLSCDVKVKIQTKPKLSGKIDDVAALEGGIITIKTTVKGDPKPIVTWSKGGKQIKDGGRYSIKCEGDVYTLIIKDATEADSGAYKLTAKSSAGEINSDVKVKVQSKPKLVGKIEDVTSVEGGVITIKTKIEGDPKPTVKWSKDGKEIKDGGRYSIQNVDCAYTLVIKDATEADAGAYKLTAQNNAGEMNTEAFVKIQTKPKLSGKMEDVSALEGSVVTIKTIIQGDPKPTVTWYKDGKQIKGGGRFSMKNEGDVYSLIIKDVTIADSGTYKFVAKSIAGEMTGEVNFNLQTKPKVINKIENVTGVVGEVVKLKTTIQGDPKPTVLWSKDGKQIKQGGRYAVKCVGDEYILEIHNATEADSGTYMMVATSIAGEISTDIKVKMLTKPKVISSVKDTEVTVGGIVTLNTTIKGNPKPTCKWTRDGKAVQDGGRISIREDGDLYTLVIKDAIKSDSGFYKLTASNSAGDTHIEIEVRVECPKVDRPDGYPEFKSLPSDVKVNEGESIKMSLTVKGYPKPSITWSKGGRPLRDGGRFSMTCDGDIHTLVIGDATEYDSGTYRVIAKSASGEIASDFDVQVLTTAEGFDGTSGRSASAARKRQEMEELSNARQSNDPKPRFEEAPSDVTVANKEAISLTCIVKGDPKPNIKWEKNGKRIRSGPRIRVYDEVNVCGLEIFEAQHEDSGEYVCSATNYHGTVTSSIKVNVIDVETAYKLRKMEKESKRHGIIIATEESSIAASKKHVKRQVSWGAGTKKF